MREIEAGGVVRSAGEGGVRPGVAPGVNPVLPEVTTRRHGGLAAGGACMAARAPDPRLPFPPGGQAVDRRAAGGGAAGRGADAAGHAARVVAVLRRVSSDVALRDVAEAEVALA